MCLWFSSATVIASTCYDYNNDKRAYFGDLHIHTGLSADAMLFGTTNRPDDAYSFARGKTIFIERQGVSDTKPMPVKIDRPLDFAAVTDHAENIGTIYLCMDPQSAVYNSQDCQFVRKPLPVDSMANFSTELTKVWHTMYTSKQICGEDRQRCNDAIKMPWKEIQDTANQWNNSCEFTTFIGYEYSATVSGANLHHNVIFGSEEVMDTPISARSVPRIYDFYAKLKKECNDPKTGCNVLAIPHNSNISNGKMFSLSYEGEVDLGKQKKLAQLRADIIPLVELFQQKGDSECRNGMWNVLGKNDEFCGFEKYRDWQNAKLEDCENGEFKKDVFYNQPGNGGGFQNMGCVSRLDYTRYALAAGIAEESRIGVNSLKFGLIGSTDNHNGTAGDIEEWIGMSRNTSLIEPERMSTGGITGVWAEENTRESIFTSMQKREVFATSGPRIQPRLFAGWNFPKDMCNDPNQINRAYAEGVPMGSELNTKNNKKAPRFLASALADLGTPKHPGTPLQRLQIIKVWPGKGDQLHQAVYDVASGETRGQPASVNTDTCELSGQGAMSLCAVWEDPDYNPTISAAYYARTIENPSCRHTGYACAAIKGEDRPAFCDKPSMPQQIQERAWTSPIWVPSQ
tara:strand:- start:1712 stop:3592 length:1881 start_codon:yes stop_codon:yes gene_type:complete